LSDDQSRFIRPKDLDNAQRTTWTAQLIWRLEAFAWDWLFWIPMSLMPIIWASNTIAAILKAAGPFTSQHRTMIRNLRMAFPEWTRQQADNVARGAWETLGRTAGEMPHLARMKPYVPNSKVEVIGAEWLDAIRASGKPAVLIGGHFANWEMIASAICNRPLDAQITYRSANNPYIDRRIAKARHAYGINVLTPKGAGTRELMRALGRGQPIALMNDQKFNQGIAVPFFGYDAMTAPGPTRLAMKFGAPLVPISCLRTAPGRYRVTVHEPFMPDTDPDEDRAIYNTVLRINQWVEARIREAPEQWFWMHNRWPKEAWVKAGVLGD
jgi:KDO2-lipid IV(A) lauroyltransferase